MQVHIKFFWNIWEKQWESHTTPYAVFFLQRMSNLRGMDYLRALLT